MSKVAPVRAALVMMWTAGAATSSGPTTLPIGNEPGRLETDAGAAAHHDDGLTAEAHAGT